MAWACSHDSQARVKQGTDWGNPGPSGTSAGGRGKEALFHWVLEALQDMARRDCRPRYTESPAPRRPRYTGRRPCYSERPAPSDLPPPAHCGVLPHGEIPTVKDFYNRLEGLEARVEQSTRLLLEVMAQLVHNNELEEERDELEERNTRLENSWSNLEAMRAIRTGTNCRAEDQEGPFLHGVGHLDVDSCCRRDMEIGRRRGGPSRFPFELFGNIKGPTTADPRGAPGSRSRNSGAQQPERAVRPYWDISTQKRLKIGWGGGSGNSMPWVIAEVWCFALTAGLWWSGTILF